jgi:hypothetical protein
MAWRMTANAELEWAGNPIPHFDLGEAKKLLEQMRKKGVPVVSEGIYDRWNLVLQNWPKNAHIDFDLIWPISGWLETDESKTATSNVAKNFLTMLFYLCPDRLSEKNNGKPTKDGIDKYTSWLAKVVSHPQNV